MIIPRLCNRLAFRPLTMVPMVKTVSKYSDYNADKLNYRILKDEDADVTLQLYKDQLITREPFCLATESNDYWDRPYIKQLTIPSGVSVGAFESSGEIVGFALGLVLTRGFENNPKLREANLKLTHDGMKRMTALWAFFLRSYHAFGDPNINTLLHLGPVVTKEEWSNRGVFTRCLKMAEEIGRQRKIDLIGGVTVVPKVKKVMEAHGYDLTQSYNMDDLILDGMTVFKKGVLLKGTMMNVYVKKL